jgi:hypothetical protein
MKGRENLELGYDDALMTTALTLTGFLDSQLP